MTQTTADYIFSIDSGNGLVNAYKSTAAGTISHDMFPSVRAVMNAGSVGLGGFELQSEIITIEGVPYVFGDEVFHSAQAIDRHVGANRYGNEFWRSLVLATIARMRVRRGSVIDLVTFAPPAMLESARAAIVERMADTTHTVTRKDATAGATETTVEFTIRNVQVMPEGAAALLNFALDETGRMQAAHELGGKNVILDMGMYTLDHMTVTNGQLNVQNIEHSTIENAGIRQHILQPVLRDVRGMGDADFSLMGVDHIDAALRQGLQHTYDDNGSTRADYRLRSAGKALNIEQFFIERGEKYAGWIADNVIDGELAGLRGYKSALLIGGGTPLVMRWLQDWYPDKIKTPDALNIDPVNMNAAAGIRYALYQQNAQEGA